MLGNYIGKSGRCPHTVDTYVSSIKCTFDIKSKFLPVTVECQKYKKNHFEVLKLQKMEILKKYLKNIYIHSNCMNVLSSIP